MSTKSENAKTGKTARVEKIGTKDVARADATEPTTVRVMDYLPAPEELARYEKVVPGGAERILEMAEQQSMHRREMEDKAVSAEIRGTRIKQVLTFVLALATGILGGILLISGSELAGLMVILVDAAAVAGIAIYGNRGSEE